MTHMHLFPSLLLFLLMPLTVSAALSQPPESFRLTVLHTNDEHSNVLPYPNIDYHPERENPALGGFARLASAVNTIREQKRRQDEPVLLVSAGDFTGGSPYGWLMTEGEAVELELMQRIGYDVITLGNHEFDHGPERLADYLHAAGYPDAGGQSVLLASNTRPPAGHPLANCGLQTTHLKELDNGLTVGFFGLLGSDAEQVAPRTDPVTFDEPKATARQAVKQLREEGADILIAVTHSGTSEDRQLARKVDGIDLIVGGHSHEAHEEPIRENGTLIVQAGSMLHYLGRIELEYREGEPLAVRNPENDRPFLVELDHETGEHEPINRVIAGYTEQLNRQIAGLTGERFTDVTQTVALSDFELSDGPPRQESQLGNFVTDAMRLITERRTGEAVDIAFQANGAIRGSMKTGSMAWSQDQISFYDLATTVGLGSGYDDHPGFPLVSFWLTSDEVRRVLEISILLSEIFSDNYFLQYSGLRMEYNARRAVALNIPFTGTPVPSSRAVLEAEKFTGNGLQRGDDFVPIEWEGEQMHHVVTDYYIASFLPLVGEVVPRLAVEPKDRDGEAVQIADRTVSYDGRELKVWETVLHHAAREVRDDAFHQRIPGYYRSTGNRIREEFAFPVLFWPSVALIGLGGVILWLVLRSKYPERFRKKPFKRRI